MKINDITIKRLDLNDLTQCIKIMCAMPKQHRSKILKKVLSHLHKDIKEQKEGASEDKQLIKTVKPGMRKSKKRK